jgi:hypothetical protein
MKKLMLVAVVVAAFSGSAVARADVATDWNRTMIAGFEAAKTTPPPGCRGGKRGVHRARRADPVAEAALRYATRSDARAALRRSVASRAIGRARPRLGPDGCDRDSHVARE